MTRVDLIQRWLMEEVRTGTFGPSAGDCQDEKEARQIAEWLDKMMADFYRWNARRTDEKPFLERTDYVNEKTIWPKVEMPLLESMPTPAVLPPPQKGTHEYDLHRIGDIERVGYPIAGVHDSLLSLEDEAEVASDWSNA